MPPRVVAVTVESHRQRSHSSLWSDPTANTLLDPAITPPTLSSAVAAIFDRGRAGFPGGWILLPTHSLGLAVVSDRDCTHCSRGQIRLPTRPAVISTRHIVGFLADLTANLLTGPAVKTHCQRADLDRRWDRTANVRSPRQLVMDWQCDRAADLFTFPGCQERTVNMFFWRSDRTMSTLIRPHGRVIPLHSWQWDHTADALTATGGQLTPPTPRPANPIAG
ncbi:hypothetical protein B0H12DRAFT_1243836 [Mycena haematopus]|nr:hypothetical protein B0H12DRAFT_1243836 [Mycena haematopus]